MRYDEFRQWLTRRGVKDNGVNTRSNSVRKIEQELAALGSTYSSLDAAYDADQFAELRRIHDEIRKDARQGGERFRILFPQTDNPLGRIASFKAYLGQYGQFRSGASQDVGLEIDPVDVYWFVGSSFGGNDDQTSRFLDEGVWEVSTPTPGDEAQVRAMQVGDRIAMKATFVRKHNLPFDYGGKSASAMRLKGRGTITENPGNGSKVSVAWDEDFEPRDWYFNTRRTTIWRRQADDEVSRRLIAFTFFDEPQDYAWFMKNSASAANDKAEVESKPRRFWIEKTLVRGRPDREHGDNALGASLWSPQRSKDNRNIYRTMLEVEAGDVVFHLIDNEAISSVSVAAENADSDFLCVEGSEWEGQPGYRITLSDHEALSPPLPRDAFLETEPFASELRELAGSGARGLFYNSRRGLNQGAYLTEATPTLLSILNRAYDSFAGQSLPYVEMESSASDTPDAAAIPYTIDDALQSLFLERETAEDILLLWRAKKNIILQGPPGVGKSFAAHKLAFALMGTEARARVGFVQFHQSYSYEDFVEGFRPTATGFELRAGKFVEFCRQAEADPTHKYVFIIDEINRGNLSKILGELMLLIEGDKRDPNWAISLASGKVPFHVPANVFIMGLMNTADRSLAVVDYALRRRFAFVDVEPNLSSPKFRDQLVQAGISEPITTALIQRIAALNAEIIGDVSNLGPGFAIGHSFFCTGPLGDEGDRAWYERIVRTEIVPLLREYWFDAPSKADSWRDQLLAAL